MLAYQSFNRSPRGSRCMSQQADPDVAYKIDVYNRVHQLRQKERADTVQDRIVTVEVHGQSLDIPLLKSTPREIFKLADVADRLDGAAVAMARVDGELWDLDRYIDKTCNLEPVTISDSSPEVQQVVAHSSAHALGYALEDLFPNIRLNIGPSTTGGDFFYEGYMINQKGDSADKISQESEEKRNSKAGGFVDGSDKENITAEFDQQTMVQINSKIKKLVKTKRRFNRMEVTVAEAAEIFKNNPFKLMLLHKAAERTELITVYRCGDFIDLCRGPHIESLKHLKFMELTSSSTHTLKPTSQTMHLSDGNVVTMHRIHGVGFGSDAQMRQYKLRMAESEKRNHRVIGASQELFMLHPASPGAPFFLPNGMRLINRLKSFLQSQYSGIGFDEVSTPLMYGTDLWKTSGHWDHYQDDMFFVSDDGHTCCAGTSLQSGLKPMNCPAHCLIFKSKARSYKDLPIRYADFSTLHRNESSGALTGLTRVRQFHQDDGHIFCTPDQIFKEVKACLNFVDETYSAFGFEYNLSLSTKPESSMGSESEWDHAEKCLMDAITDNGKTYSVDEGGGAFYGPKIDITLTDAIGRHHQTATVQLDFQLPERFGLEYVDTDGTKQRPVMIHRAVFGSLERFFAILCEHTAGRWPLWLSPNQILVLPVSPDNNKHTKHASEVVDALEMQGYDVSVDMSNKTLNSRLKRARPLRHNYVVVVGDEEVETGKIDVKCREKEKSLGKVELPVFLTRLDAEMLNRTSNSFKESLQEI